jgi:hypothetical protein
MLDLFSGPILSTDNCITQIVNLYTLVYDTFTSNINNYKSILTTFLAGPDEIIEVYDNLIQLLNESHTLNNRRVKDFYEDIKKSTLIEPRPRRPQKDTELEKDFRNSVYFKSSRGDDLTNINQHDYTALSQVFSTKATDYAAAKAEYDAEEAARQLYLSTKSSSNQSPKISDAKVREKKSIMTAALKAMTDASNTSNAYLLKLNELTDRRNVWATTKLVKENYIGSLNTLSSACSSVYKFITGTGEGIKRKGRKILRKKQFTRKLPRKIIKHIKAPKIAPSPIKTRKYKIQKHKKTRKHHRKQNRKHHKKTHKHKTPLERLRAKLQPKSTRRRQRV